MITLKIHSPVLIQILAQQQIIHRHLLVVVAVEAAAAAAAAVEAPVPAPAAALSAEAAAAAGMYALSLPAAPPVSADEATAIREARLEARRIARERSLAARAPAPAAVAEAAAAAAAAVEAPVPARIPAYANVVIGASNITSSTILSASIL